MRDTRRVSSKDDLIRWMQPEIRSSTNIPDSQTPANCCSGSMAATERPVAGPSRLTPPRRQHSSGYRCLLEALLLPMRTYILYRRELNT